MHNIDEFRVENFQMELENRVRNLLWTVSGDYKLEFKPDVSLFLRSKSIALYDGIKQGALVRYFDRDQLALYLVRKVYMGADEKQLTMLSQLCVEEAIGERLVLERPGIATLQQQAFSDILDQEYEELPSQGDLTGRLRVEILGRRIRQADRCSDDRLEGLKKIVSEAARAGDAMELIRVIDRLYNSAVDPSFEKTRGTLADVLAVSLEELMENDWRDFLTEELYEDALESYIEQLSMQVAGMENQEVTKDLEEQRNAKHKVRVLPPEALEKTHSYVELNFGKTYLTETEEKRMNYLLCREIHGDCSLYFTDGILESPVRRNYQYEYAKRLRGKNVYLYHDKYRIVRRNIADLTQVLKKSLVLRSEVQEILSDRGTIIPSRVWRVGRSSEATIFRRELKGDAADFVVDVLIDASGSQMSRQGDVALQAYMISQALGNVGIPRRVMSYCTFWDYTIMHRLREYDEGEAADEKIFNYVTSSNNRDGLALRAAGTGLLARPEEKKILIVLSDGRPYDVILNRPNAKNPKPYQGSYAVADTAGEVRKLRNLGVSVLGVFAGEEKDLGAEKKIFGKDFAYIRDISGFSKIVGRYLTRQLEADQ
ncbi:MAG: nitric oxide reductase activation protein [Blautia sp.]|nr:nitric oxide reductase activation protein [Blautia sp.]